MDLPEIDSEASAGGGSEGGLAAGPTSKINGVLEDAAKEYGALKAMAEATADALQEFSADPTTCLSSTQRDAARRAADAMHACSPQISFGVYCEPGSDRLRARVLDRAGCKNSLCPICRRASQYRRAEDVRRRVLPHLSKTEAFLATLTLPSSPAFFAHQNVARITKAFGRLQKRASKSPSKWPVTGSVRFVESPWQASHPKEEPTTNTHAHCVFLVTPVAAKHFDQDFLGEAWADVLGVPWAHVDKPKQLKGKALDVAGQVHAWAAYGSKGPHLQQQFGSSGDMNLPGQLPLNQSPEVVAHYLDLFGVRMFAGSGCLFQKVKSEKVETGKLVGKRQFSWDTSAGRYSSGA